MLITGTSQIKHNTVFSKGLKVFEGEEGSDFTVFIKSAFKNLNQPYPKFYKMDNLCKLAFVGAEVLLGGIDLLQKYNREDIALVFLNGASTIDTDREHQLTIDSRENYFPGPAVFVYTLPNIMLGEICIKNKFFGENILLVSDKFDADLIYRQTDIMFKKNKAKVVITGWIDIDAESYSACLMLVEADNMVSDVAEFTTFASSNIELEFNK
jgi:hypothetical protein